MSEEVNPNLVTLTYAIYALHLFSAVTGLITTAFIVTMFLTGWPSIIAVILNYAKRSDTEGTYLQSHFRWQIRTFWFACLWAIVAMVLALTVVGIPLAYLVAVLVGVWVLYRMISGILKLSSQEAMPI